MPKKATIRQARYDAANTVRVTMKLNRRIDAPILARLKAAPSMSGYLRQLILEDIRRNAPQLLNSEPLEKSAEGIQSLGKPSPRKDDKFYGD